MKTAEDEEAAHERWDTEQAGKAKRQKQNAQGTPAKLTTKQAVPETPGGGADGAGDTRGGSPPNGPHTTPIFH